MMLLLALMSGCAPVDRAHSTNSLSPSPGPTPNLTGSPNMKIEAAMQWVEFERPSWLFTMGNAGSDILG
jgi:hypothetical protein